MSQHSPAPRAPRPLLSVALLLGLAACGADRIAAPATPETPAEPTPVHAAEGPAAPDDPGPADVRFTLSSATQTPISRFIYGLNMYEGWKGVELPANLTLSRQGGNRLTAYNWENNASNAGSDWNYSSDGYLGGGEVPGEAVRTRVAGSFAKGAGIIVTVPTIGYVAADKNGPTGSDEAGWATRMATRFRESRPRKGAPFTATPSTADRYVYQDEFVWWLNQAFPGAKSDPEKPIFYSLDNEPDIWHETHEEIRSRVGGKVNYLTYDDLVQRTVDYAAAIKDVVPGGQVFGGVTATWSGLQTLGRTSPDPVAKGQDFVDYFLDRMRDAERTHGRRLLDVLDLHWYTEARADGKRVNDDSAPESPARIQARVQSTRSLWDPTYNEGSWVNQVIGGPIALLPRLRDRIAAHYPGTKIAISEYYYGRGGDISGGVAQADALGIFGREGVFAATLWPSNSDAYGGDRAKGHAYVFGAFRMFRDYDGQRHSFGDTGLSAVTSDAVKSSVYASIDAGRPERVVVVAINKTDAPQSAGITLAHTRTMHRAEVYTLTGSSPVPQRQADVSISKHNAFVYTMPPMSVTTLVLVE